MLLSPCCRASGWRCCRPLPTTTATAALVRTTCAGWATSRDRCWACSRWAAGSSARRPPARRWSCRSASPEAGYTGEGGTGCAACSGSPARLRLTTKPPWVPRRLRLSKDWSLEEVALPQKFENVPYASSQSGTGVWHRSGQCLQRYAAFKHGKTFCCAVCDADRRASERSLFLQRVFHHAIQFQQQRQPPAFRAGYLGQHDDTCHHWSSVNRPRPDRKGSFAGGAWRQSA
uniref:Uncharacterized protein n=1 Tax=Ralstonia solanacearum TaxID=305 RepID=A0A0S4U9C5_RALSL|nr:protein of unknown function [Ralstonia solanacearum]